jgi:hypothetical protein
VLLLYSKEKPPDTTVCPERWGLEKSDTQGMHEIQELGSRWSLSYSRKLSLFGRAVAKTREAWQTLTLYRARISKVHQTPPGLGKTIWSCSLYQWHTNCKKNGEKRPFFGGDIWEMNFWYHLQSDYKTLCIHRLHYTIVRLQQTLNTLHYSPTTCFPTTINRLWIHTLHFG